jgi:hypothetical protein
MSRLGSVYFAGSTNIRVILARKKSTGCLPFGSSLSASLARFILTTFINGSHVLTILLSLAPRPFNADGHCLHLADLAFPFERASFSG